MDRKTAAVREAPRQPGLSRDAGFAAVDDELVGEVIAAVRPERPYGHGRRVKRQIDFAQLGFITDVKSAAPVDVSIFTAVVSRHMFVWISRPRDRSGSRRRAQERRRP